MSIATSDGLARLNAELGWPEPRVVMGSAVAPDGVYHRLVRGKIGASLKRRYGEDAVEVGVLAPVASSGDSDAPLAIVCVFTRSAPVEALQEAHRLAWNFCHVPLLVTVDPFRISAWSCFSAPTVVLGQADSAASEIEEARCDLASGVSLADQAAASLEWLSLLDGAVIRRHEHLFKPVGRADRMLLSNLKSTRARLLGGTDGLPADLAHDLIARLMFVQFLFDRKDMSGVSALDADRLAELHATGVLRRVHATLASLLADYDDAYLFFRWLNDRFNGDLFPAKSADPREREAEWRGEMARVRPGHLATLADLVSGQLDVGTGQLELWKLYSFDVLPLEFVSSIYEEFVSAKPRPAAGRAGKEPASGTHYTPTHLVDFILDGVLPWDGEGWDIRIMDPACGSGAFLVRAFQRLVHRWRRAHPGETIPVEVLVGLLERNLFGVDRDRQASRVASFSLYLAMCDEIDPRRYWTEVRFPILRERRIVTSDFFAPGREGFDDAAAGDGYDLIVGNAPWGEKTISEAALTWASAPDTAWPIRYADIGVLFLAKALRLARPGGRVAMLQSAGTLLLNARSAEVRGRLFDDAQVDEIVNFAITRRRLFPTAESPACLVTLTAGTPEASPTVYVTPKLRFTEEDGFRISIDDLDVHVIHPEEVADPWTWTVLMAGTRRDLDLLRRLRQAGTTLRALRTSGDIVLQEGVKPAEAGVLHPELRDRRCLFDVEFPRDTFLRLHIGDLPIHPAIKVRRHTNPAVFEAPQLILKQAWRKETRRFRAAVVDGTQGVVCSQSYVSARSITEDGASALRSLCMAFNSRLATYHLALTTGRIAYRPELRVSDIEDFPFDPRLGTAIDDIVDFSDLDRTTERWARLRESERVLVDDALDCLIPELLRDRGSVGRRATPRVAEGTGPTPVAAFCETVIRVLRGGTGDGGDRHSATVFEEEDGTRRLPLRVAAVHLGSPSETLVRSVSMGTGKLRALVERLNLRDDTKHMSTSRVVTAFDTVRDVKGCLVPTVYFIRPDEMRFWCRSAAYREADRLLADGMWTATRPPSDERGGTIE